MTKLFTQILQMSISAGYVILAILLFRLLLKKAPKKYSYALWSAAAFRLLCPYSISSVVSLFNIHFGGKERPAVDLTGVTADPGSDIIAVDTGIPIISQMIRQVTDVGASVPVNETIDETIVSAAQEIAPVQQVISPVDIIAWIWVTGVIALFAYGLISYVKLQRKMRMSMPLRDNIRQAYIRTPFILGFIKPTIYIPFDLEPMVENISISHERCHIHRGDHIVKLLSYLILIIHWFNPLCWLAYFEMGKDMEMSVDEYVLSHYRDISRSYSTALLSFSTGKRFALASPLAFGERNVKERIVNAMKFKNATRFVSVIAAVMCILVLVACGTNGNPNTEPDSKEEITPAPNDTETETTFFNLLTGLPVDELIKPVALTINNVRSARSIVNEATGEVEGRRELRPWGIYNADILIQYDLGGGLTRYIAMYSDVRDIVEVAGIVEATTTEPDILNSCDIISVHNAYYLYNTDDIKESFKEKNVMELDINKHQELASIKEDYALVEKHYAWMVDGNSLWNYMNENGLTACDNTRPFLPFAGAEDKIEFSNKAEHITFVLSRAEQVRFDYDHASERYYKKESIATMSTDTTLQECVDMQNGEIVQFDNVILLYVSAESDDMGYTRVYDFTNEGDGYYFTKGTYEKISWYRGSNNELVFINSDHDTVNINCGKSYIALIAVGEDNMVPGINDRTSGLEPLEIIA